MLELNSFIQNEYLQSVLILLIGFVAATLFRLFVVFYSKKIAVKTKTVVDDVIFKIIEKPGHFLILLIAFYFSLKSLSFLEIYSFWVDGLFFTLGVFAVSFLLSHALNVLINQWLKVKKKYEKTPKLIGKVLSVTIFLIGFLVILSYFRVEITPFIATLGIGGLAIGLALQGTLSNFFAGLHIISDRPIQVGDFIELEDGKISGYVDDIGWRSTRIMTIMNTVIIVPNAKLAESNIVNFSMPEKEISLYIECGVSYLSDLDKTEKITLDTAKKIQETVSGAVKGFEPKMRFFEFGDSNINFRVTVRIQKFTDRFQVRHEFIKALKKAFDREGIEISWPVRKIYQEKQNQL
ncbi:MAG: mechanosensitive ion channel family protein [Candidatus Diapherotrites archaeon]